MYASIPEAINDLQQGKMIVLVDDADRENEGDLVISAEHINADAINFMSTHGRTVICVPIAPEVADKVGLRPMVQDNQNQYHTAFTLSIEAAEGVSTGISCEDRAHTIRTLIHPEATSRDIISPGHIFPLRAVKGGVLERPGHTEGSVDLMRLAGLAPASVICEVMNDDGSMAREPDLREFAKKHGLKMVAIKDIITHRLQHENLVISRANAILPVENLGEFNIEVFEYPFDKLQHIVLSKPNKSQQPMLLRIHSECFTGDLLGSVRCDCGAQLDSALTQIAEQGGMLLYMRQEGRGIGLINKIQSYALQDKGLDTVEANHELGYPADSRDYGICAQILKHYGIQDVRLLTNNPRKIAGLNRYGIHVANRVSLEVDSHPENLSYLQTKRDKLGHLLSLKEQQYADSTS